MGVLQLNECAFSDILRKVQEGKEPDSKDRFREICQELIESELAVLSVHCRLKDKAMHNAMRRCFESFGEIEGVESLKALILHHIISSILSQLYRADEFSEFFSKLLEKFSGLSKNQKCIALSVLVEGQEPNDVAKQMGISLQELDTQMEFATASIRGFLA